MRAVVWQGRRTVQTETVPDPRIVNGTDAIIRVTSTALCGSDLHLYEVLAPFMAPGDILGHEPMGVVEAVGSAITNLSVGDRVVIPFNISCGHCFMCEQGLQSQCETTQNHEHGCGGALFGYTKLYGQVPGAQAELLRVPHADYGAIVVPEGPPDDRFLYLSDVLPTAWQSLAYADVPDGGSLAIIGLGPIGLMAGRIARHRGIEPIIGIDRIPSRLAQARADGLIALDTESFDSTDDLRTAVQEYTQGRGPDAVVDAVGMEASGSPGAKMARMGLTVMPDAIAERLMLKAGFDQLAALHLAIDLVRRGGTISIVGVYGGMMDPLPMMTLFDKQIQLRMGQANVRRWVDEILPLLNDEDPLGVDDFATHHLPLESAPAAYEMFQKKHDGAIKVVFRPNA